MVKAGRMRPSRPRATPACRYDDSDVAIQQACKPCEGEDSGLGLPEMIATQENAAAAIREVDVE
jgi:hypothetical protein